MIYSSSLEDDRARRLLRFAQVPMVRGDRGGRALFSGGHRAPALGGASSKDDDSAGTNQRALDSLATDSSRTLSAGGRPRRLGGQGVNCWRVTEYRWTSVSLAYTHPANPQIESVLQSNVIVSLLLTVCGVEEGFP